LPKSVLAISNQATFMGGGEHSFLDLISHLPGEYPVIASMPSEDALSTKARKKGISTVIIPVAPINPTCLHQTAKTILQLKRACKTQNIRLIDGFFSQMTFILFRGGRIHGTL